MSCRGIADTYHDSYNNVEELNFAHQEYDHIRKSGRQPYINYAALDLTTAYIDNNLYDEAFELCQTLLDSATVSSDENLRYCALRSIGLISLKRNLYSEAESIYSEVCQSNFAQSNDSLYLSFALTGLKDTESALAILDRVSDNDNLTAHYVRQNILSSIGDYQGAFYETQKIDSLSYKFIKNHIDNGLITAVGNYLELEKKLSDTQAAAATTRLWLTISIGLLLLIIILWIFNRIYRQQQNLLERKLLLAQELEELLRENKAKSDQTTITLKQILTSNNEIINDLCNIINQYGSTPAASTKMLDTVTRIIDDFSNESDKGTILENHVNKLYEDILSDLRNDLPKMKEADYKLFLFSVLGFSLTSISVFLKEKKITAVYDRKRRLKDKIKTLDSIKSERYLAFLN